MAVFVTYCEITTLCLDKMLQKQRIQNFDVKGNLVSGPLDNIGYVPFDEALAKCENIARWRVEEEISRSKFIEALKVS